MPISKFPREAQTSHRKPRGRQGRNDWPILCVEKHGCLKKGCCRYGYRISSSNGHFARLSSDGKYRAVIALEDPGVPNWLDPAGYTEGGIYGRWYDCDSEPSPTIRRVKLSALRDHLPADTPIISPVERTEELRLRVQACQRRRRW